MDSQLIWKEEFKIGVKIIDEAHERLFRIINKLFSLSGEENRSMKACQEGIKYFKEHALKHFEDEETYMELIGYKNLETHRRVHRGFREETLPALEQELRCTDYSPEAVGHFLTVCAGWLIGHTLTEDRAITGQTVSRWVNLLPEEELEAMKKVLLELLDSMFHLKASVISQSYGGEKFGKGIYYRLVYSREQDDEKWEILLVFEEKVLLNTVGSLMGVRSGRLDVMFMNAVRYTASQFVGHVMDYVPAISTYEMTEESFLTYEQFQSVLERENPQISLLFNTNKGYFAFCVIAPHSLLEDAGTPLKVYNELSEIEKYLKKREDSRQKILVVDDSITIRQGIKQLLRINYDVSAASSATSAIRAITLNRPDLVLLDYEMPVCDGRHVFEMLRSEEEFADIPVMFLTSKDDEEVVTKILSLKPEGYLLKYLKATEIKKRIDDYLKMRKAG
jgi:hemerythrin-like metal-binding protein